MTVLQLLGLIAVALGFVATRETWLHCQANRWIAAIIIMITVAATTIMAGYLGPKMAAEVYVGLLMVSCMVTLVIMELKADIARLKFD